MSIASFLASGSCAISGIKRTFVHSLVSNILVTYSDQFYIKICKFRDTVLEGIVAVYSFVHDPATISMSLFPRMSSSINSMTAESLPPLTAAVFGKVFRLGLSHLWKDNWFLRSFDTLSYGSSSVCHIASDHYMVDVSRWDFHNGYKALLAVRT